MSIIRKIALLLFISPVIQAAQLGYYSDAGNPNDLSGAIDVDVEKFGLKTIYPKIDPELEKMNVGYLSDFFDCIMSDDSSACLSGSKYYDSTIKTLHQIRFIKEAKIDFLARWGDLVAYNLEFTLEDLGVSFNARETIIFDCSSKKCLYTNAFSGAEFNNNTFSIYEVFNSVFDARDWSRSVDSRQLGNLFRVSLMNGTMNGTTKDNNLDVYLNLIRLDEQSIYNNIIEKLSADFKTCVYSSCSINDVMETFFGEEYESYQFPFSIIEKRQLMGAGFIDMQQMSDLLNDWSDCRAFSKLTIDNVERVFFQCQTNERSHIIVLPFFNESIKKDFVSSAIDNLLATKGVADYVFNFSLNAKNFQNKSIEGEDRAIVDGRLGERKISFYSRVEVDKDSESPVPAIDDFSATKILFVLLFLLFLVFIFYKKKR